MLKNDEINLAAKYWNGEKKWKTTTVRKISKTSTSLLLLPNLGSLMSVLTRNFSIAKRI